MTNSEACALTACEFESRHRRLQRFLDSRTAAKDEIDRIAADFIGEHPLVRCGEGGSGPHACRSLWCLCP